MATPDAVGEAPRGDRASKPPRGRAGSYSGRLLLRMPASLHEELARASDRDGVSLNQYITSVLAGAVGWRRENSGSDHGAAAVAKARPRSLSILLAVNLVLVAAAAVAAIVFLIAAWLN